MNAFAEIVSYVIDHGKVDFNYYRDRDFFITFALYKDSMVLKVTANYFQRLNQVAFYITLSEGWRDQIECQFYNSFIKRNEFDQIKAVNLIKAVHKLGVLNG